MAGSDNEAMMLVFIFPYLKKDEYEVWAMKMEYFITNNDMNIWKRESKARTTLLQSILDDHVDDFHYMDDARDIWNAVKARFGGNAESKKMRKSMLKQEFLEFRISKAEGLHKGTTSASKKMSYADSPSYSSSTYIAPSNSKTGSHRSGNVIEDVLQSFVADTEPEQQLAYEDFEQIEKMDLEEMDLKWQMDMLSSYGVIAPKEFGMFACCDTEDAIEEGAAKIYNLITRADTKEASTAGDAGEFALMGVISEFVPHLTSGGCLHSPPPPLSGDYTPLSDHIDLDESQMSYGTKSSTSSDSNSVSNDFVSCDNSDKSSEVNTNDFASSDSSVKSSEPKSNKVGGVREGRDAGRCSQTSSVSTSESEAEIESNVGTPIQEPIIAGHFRKNASSVSKLCFVCGSSTHLIKDCDFYEKQMANKTVGNGVGPVHSRNNVNHQNQFVLQVVLLRTGKVNIPPARRQPVPTMILLPSIRKILSDAEDERGSLTMVVLGICDKKNKVLFTDTDCLVLSKDFMLPDESMVVLRVPRKHNLYTINLNNLSPRGNLACLVAKALVDESVKWHRRMGHVNYKNMNRLVKGKQHKASYKAITAVSSISEPLQLLHMDLFEHKDETYPILKDFINLVENQLNKKVKAIRCDNGTEFKNAHIIELCGSKGIKRDYSNGRTPRVLVMNGTQAADLDSECDEQVIIVPSYPSHIIQEAESKDTSGDEVDDSPLDSAEEIFQQELARLKGQEQRATYDAKDAEELQKRASTKTVPTGCILIPSGDTTISPSDVSVSTRGVPVPTSSSTDSFFDDEPTTRFPSPSDLGNNEPSPGIFSSSSYDDEFGADLNNLASTVEVSPVATNKVNKTTTGESAFIIIFLPQRAIIQTSTLSVCLFSSKLNQEVVAQALEDQAGLMHAGRNSNSSSSKCYRCALSFMTNYRKNIQSPKGFVDLQHPKKVYKVVKALYGLHQAPRACQHKYVQEILKKFDLEYVRTATTPYEAPKPKSKNEPDSPINVHLYRSMIDFKYLKHPKLGLWYPRESPFMLEAYSDSDYAGANKDRKSTTGDVMFLGRGITCNAKSNNCANLFYRSWSMLLLITCYGHELDTEISLWPYFDEKEFNNGSSIVAPSSVPDVPTGSFHFPTGVDHFLLVMLIFS
ncbi:putative ribonuclease H-like domain-containing protein [Tanacetum coccineum]|uniref:Ribonuclease H-like domain-containing protein n=1 Tax=Tanacetum coccineum TaxID=301880 RepID=A0ABQ4YY67_9ASTR